MSGEYISRDAVLIVLDWDCASQDALNAIKAIPPADVVEVVRCGECIYYHDYTCDRWADGTFMEPTDYCSRAAKMDGGQEDV